MKPSNSTTCGTTFKSIVVASSPTTGSTSKVTPVLRVSQFWGVVGVTTTGTVVEPPTTVFPVLLLIAGTCGGVNELGYRNSLITSTMARCPLLVVTFGAERRSTPFF